MSRRFEGTWEEVSANAPEFSGHRVRLTLLDNRRTTVQRKRSLNLAGSTETNSADSRMNVIPGRNHGKLFKDWEQETAPTDISADELDAFECAVAENRAMRRELAQDSDD